MGKLLGKKMTVPTHTAVEAAKNALSAGAFWVAISGLISKLASEAFFVASAAGSHTSYDHDRIQKRVRQMEYTKEDCIALLRSVSARLAEAGDGRLPRRADLSDREVCAIKAHLGPWPRALEAAGLKPPREVDRLERNREKRIRAARRINAARREAKKVAAAGSAASATAAEAPKEQE